MSGSGVLWLPGTDHAGIATQNVVEKQLASEGIDRHELGREAFIERVWKWKAEYGGKIIHQLKRLGASCDWTRERFTLDRGLSEAVREVFVKLYEEGLIYRDNRLINWCPRCRTALSDLEVEYEEFDGKLTYMKYPLSDEQDTYIIVATTRPETMLGDTAVAVHPEDSRYQDYIGKTVTLPLAERRIPVITDSSVDKEFGTGAVKITPAHDFNDEAIAKRQDPPLEFINIIGDDGRMTEHAGQKYKGLDRYECRKRVVKDLRELGFIEKEEIHKHAVGNCYRCKTITEPLPTPQWYVNVRSMSQEAVKAVKEGRITIVPKGWENTYFSWMEDIKDWCVSRQIWWGHRIPVWYCQEKRNDLCRKADGIFVARHDPRSCPYCKSTRLAQDDDVLDTWFSSALWPFSTLGWPERTEDLKTFYPTSVLITGFDIIFFWVARMIMMGLKFMGDVPFRDVYIHALVRDMQGQKMSKSKGNVIDPLILIDRYGTDAFRFTLAAFAAQGRDIKFSEGRVEGYRHFVNKLWNAARFIMMNVEAEKNKSTIKNIPVAHYPGVEETERPKDLPSRWILSRLALTADEVNRALKDYRFNDAASSIYQFIWHEFCDWYIELAKIEMKKPVSEQTVKWTLLYTLDTSLRLLHPFMPFVTEEIWQTIISHHFTDDRPSDPDAQVEGTPSLMVAEFPVSLARNKRAESEMSIISDAVSGVRTIRGELNIPPSVKLDVMVKTFTKKAEKVLTKHEAYLKGLARIEKVLVGENTARPDHSAISIKSAMEIYVPIKGILDVQAEIQRLEKDREKIEESLKFINKKLLNEDFLKRAPKEVVEKEKGKYDDHISMKERITSSIKILKGVGVQNGYKKGQ
jgi:valyl-tRNA synthetase